jgi:hypothetical protein
VDSKARYLDRRPCERLDISLTRTRNTASRVATSSQMRDGDWQKARRPRPHAVILSSPARDFFARKTIPSSLLQPRCSPRTPTHLACSNLPDESHPPHHSTRTYTHPLTRISFSISTSPSTTNSPDTSPYPPLLPSLSSNQNYHSKCLSELPPPELSSRLCSRPPRRGRSPSSPRPASPLLPGLRSSGPSST